MNTNPWELQKTLMDAAASEPAPTEYIVNKLSVLYAALVLEETSELTAGMSKVLGRLTDDSPTCKLHKLSMLMNVIEDFLEEASLDIRKMLESMEEFETTLTTNEVVELADASTDIAVVNCGFAIASGIPGSECYNEIVGSNLSKRNPTTGKIDKDASGKWIKGSEYRPPNLKSVLFKDA